jgi:uncharacterized membrane protein YqaE (UPF0057 family)
MALPAISQIATLPLIDRIKAYIVAAFSILVGIAFLASLGCMIYFKVKESGVDISLWVNVFLTCLGYIVGILTGLLGIPASTPPPSPPKDGV